MRHTLLVILALSLNTAVYSQVENIIYKKVIDEYVLNLRQPNIDYTLKTTLTVLDKPSYIDSLGVDDYARFKEKYPNLDKQTFLDFINKNQMRVQFENIHIPNIEFVVFKKDSVPKHDELILSYPYWIFSILEFSNIGFNKEHDQALVYYSFNSGAGVGGSFYMVYEKKRKKWKQKGFIPAWAS